MQGGRRGLTIAGLRLHRNDRSGLSIVSAYVAETRTDQTNRVSEFERLDLQVLSPMLYLGVVYGVDYYFGVWDGSGHGRYSLLRPI
jgi:hypothetical protein